MRAIDGDALAELLSGVRRRLDPKAYKTATEFYTRDEMLLNLEQITRTAPTIDPVKHGVWVQGYPITCSVCGKPAIEVEDNDLKYTARITDYCPHCGARMDANE